MFWQVGGAVHHHAGPGGRRQRTRWSQGCPWGYVLCEIRPRPYMSEYPELHIVGWNAHRSA